MSRRLKDKVWRSCQIDIDRLVEQIKDGNMITNDTVAYLVTIHHGGGRRTMFRADSQKELWEHIIESTTICYTKAEIEQIQATRKPYVPRWKQIMEVK